jgi:hypothetical protein
MGDKGKKDKGKREQQKKAQLSPPTQLNLGVNQDTPAYRQN